MTGTIFDVLERPESVLVVTNGNLDSIILLSTLFNSACKYGFVLDILARGKRPEKTAYVLKCFTETINLFFQPRIYVDIMPSDKTDAERFYDKKIHQHRPVCFERWATSSWGNYDLIVHDSDRKHLKNISTHPLIGERSIIFREEKSKKYDFIFGQFKYAIAVDSSCMRSKPIHPDSFIKWSLFREYNSFLKKKQINNELITLNSVLFSPLASIKMFTIPYGENAIKISGEINPEKFYECHMTTILSMTTHPDSDTDMESVNSDYFDSEYTI